MCTCHFPLHDLIDFWCLTPLSAIFQLYHGDQFKWWKKPEYPERTIDHGQATGKLHMCGIILSRVEQIMNNYY